MIISRSNIVVRPRQEEEVLLLEDIRNPGRCLVLGAKKASSTFLWCIEVNHSALPACSFVLVSTSLIMLFCLFC